MMDVTTTTTYRIADWALADLARRFAQLARRADRIGVPAPTFEVVGTQDVPEMVPDLSYEIDGHMIPSGRTLHFLVVTVSGTAPSFDGWQPIAVIDRDLDDAPDGPHVVHVFDGVDADPAWRTAPDFCDYCAEHGRTHPQGRKTLVVVEHDDQARKVVGTTCLKDFLGHAAPESIAAWIETISTLDDLLGSFGDDAEFGVTHGEYRYDPAAYLAWVAATIRTSGWVPRRQAMFHGQATADTAAQALADFARGRRDRFDTGIVPPTDVDVELADAALAWAADIPATVDNDYLANVAAVAHKSGWRTRDIGIGASIISAYKRQVERDLARQADAAALAASAHVGTVGDRITFGGTVIFDRDFDGAYGVTRLFKIVTDDGNLLVWFASNGGPWVTDEHGTYRQVTQGDRIVGKAAVKRHEVRDGVAQTQITRATKVALAAPTLLEARS